MTGFTPPPEFDGYRIVRLLGHGTMGHVYLAEDALLERPVAIKFLSARDPHPQEKERLLLEARAIARLSHPNVVSIHRVGECLGRPYLVSEYVRGEGLDKLPKPMPWRRALRIGIGLSRGLAAAHRAGVVHRDIKPANALIVEDGEAKLVDFGLAKLLDARSPPRAGRKRAAGHLPQAALDTTLDLPLLGGALKAASHWPEVDSPGFTESETLRPLAAQAHGLEETQRGAILGTPLYMSPECWRGEPATFRSDVFSLGAVLYHLCAGRPPSEGPGVERVRDGTLGQPGAPEAPLAAVDARLARTILRCLRRDPAERFAGGDELRAALEAIDATPSLRRAARLAIALSAAASLLGAGAAAVAAQRLQLADATQLALAQQGLWSARAAAAKKSKAARGRKWPSPESNRDDLAVGGF